MEHRFSLLTINDQELATARRVLGAIPVVQDDHYLYGTANDQVLRALLEQGLLVNVVPDDVLHPFLEPDNVRINSLLSDVGLPITGMPDGPMTHCRVTLAGPINTERQQVLAGIGIKLLRKLSQSAYLGVLRSEELPESPPAWVSIARYGIDAKLDRQSLDRALPILQRSTWRVLTGPLAIDNGTVTPDTGTGPSPEPVPTSSDGFVTYDLRTHAPASLQLVERWLRSRLTDVEAGDDRIRFRVAAGATEQELLATLARIEEVSIVEAYVPPMVDVAYATRIVLGKMPAVDSPWKGRGQLVGVADTGIDADHPDLRGRVTTVLRVAPLSARDPKGHGTHVASIIAGNGAASQGVLTGLAPEANLFVQSLADAALKLQVGVGLKPLLRESYDRGVRIQNYSWGSPVKGRYTLDADDIDAFVYQHPDMLVIVAGGNSGTEGIDDPDARIALESLASPGSAKNCLTVGASCSSRPDGPYAGLTWNAYDGSNPPRRPPMSELPITGNSDVVAALSSRGPSDDGRIKPDLVAPGIGIAAARSADSEARHPYPGFDGHYQYMSGTSMAAPMVSAAAAIARQYYIEKRGHTPSAALLKATLINGASWIEGELWEDPDIGEPNFHQGFGRLSLERAIPLSDGEYGLAFADVANDAPQAIYNDGERQRWVKILQMKKAGPLSITLVWVDPPGRSIQHELDLVVVAPSGTKYVGNAHLRRLAYEAFDRQNNVEQVRIFTPEPGDWAVYVHARNTYRGVQGFSIVMTGGW
ncbi:S8 family serine peptidase [Massilia psychrophila]|nr:S8 family serine peptidase [Massilia psychrophila]GGE82236.1 hypothetical protein GCM10008020_28950 [Massilia psychrophila]